MNQRYQCHIDVLIQQYHILPMKHTVHRFMFICIHTYIKCTSNYNPNSHRATTDILVINTILSQNMNTAACWFTDPNKQAGEREEFRFYLMLIIVEDSELSKSLQITGNAAGPFHNQLLPIKTRSLIQVGSIVTALQKKLWNHTGCHLGPKSMCLARSRE